MTTIRSVNDISDALAASYERGGLVITEADLSPEFFDLGSGFAGELLQKFVNHRARLAIVLADTAAYGKRFSELVYEHRTHDVVRFFDSESDALRWLQQ
jgi:hypothetical protein